MTKYKYLPGSFLLFSLLGLAWGLAHVGLEVLTGKSLLKLGLPFTLLWATVLVVALRGQRWAAPVAVLMGALGCYWTAIMHFRGADWSGGLPWMRDPENAGPLWVIPYNGLVYAGLVVGLGILWTGMQILRRIPAALAVSAALVLSSVALTLWYGGPALSAPRLIGVGLLPLATMLLARAVGRAGRPRPSA